MRRTVAIGAAMLVQAACANSGILDTEGSLSEGAAREAVAVQRVNPQPLPLTMNSGVRDSVRVVITTEAEWADWWTRIWANHIPTPARPNIDFSREMVVLAALGERMSGGYGIFVDSAYTRGGEIEVVVRKVAPSPDCGVTAALTQPVDAARLPRSALTVRFREKQEVVACG